MDELPDCRGLLQTVNRLSAHSMAQLALYCLAAAMRTEQGRQALESLFDRDTAWRFRRLCSNYLEE
jgi:hypothetical protein